MSETTTKTAKSDCFRDACTTDALPRQAYVPVATLAEALTGCPWAASIVVAGNFGFMAFESSDDAQTYLQGVYTP